MLLSIHRSERSIVNFSHPFSSCPLVIEDRYTFILSPPHLSAHTAPAPAGSRAESASGICSPRLGPAGGPARERENSFFPEFGVRISDFGSRYPSLARGLFRFELRFVDALGFFRRFCSRILRRQKTTKRALIWAERLPRECDRAGLIPGVSPVHAHCDCDSKIRPLLKTTLSKRSTCAMFVFHRFSIVCGLS